MRYLMLALTGLGLALFIGCDGDTSTTDSGATDSGTTDSGAFMIQIDFDRSLV
jgi:hypothetical protein